MQVIESAINLDLLLTLITLYDSPLVINLIKVNRPEKRNNIRSSAYGFASTVSYIYIYANGAITRKTLLNFDEGSNLKSLTKYPCSPSFS